MFKLLIWICLMILGILGSLIPVAGVAMFNVVNNCEQTVWPGILSNAGLPPLEPSGFALQTGESKVLTATPSWRGRFWGRTHCSEDSDSKFTCATADCGSGKVECGGAGGIPPATLAEFSLGDGGMDFFDVSLVDGFNLPMLVSPSGGSGHNCTSVGCTVDLNKSCPANLKVMNSDGEAVACKSACEYDSYETCKHSLYSQLLKTACPRTSTYAHGDNKNTIFTCTGGANYQITFCATPSTSSKNPKEDHHTPTTPQFNTTGMAYEGATGSNIGKVIGKVIGLVVGVVLLLLGAGYACNICTGNVNILNVSCNWCSFGNGNGNGNV